jgi:hypothetical protein
VQDLPEMGLVVGDHDTRLTSRIRLPFRYTSNAVAVDTLFVDPAGLAERLAHQGGRHQVYCEITPLIV